MKPDPSSSLLVGGSLRIPPGVTLQGVTESPVWSEPLKGTIVLATGGRNRGCPPPNSVPEEARVSNLLKPVTIVPPMKTAIHRRQFLNQSAAICAAVVLGRRRLSAEPEAAAAGLDFPLVDLHVHLDNSTIEKVLALPAAGTVKFGIVEHAGTKENLYPVVLSSDAELKARNAMLEGKPVYKGVQTEWTDWMGCFSREALAQLDYVLTDTMTFPGKNGQRIKLWEPGVEERVDMADREAFMDRYVEWHGEILSKQPIDILANVSWLPAPLANDYEKFWTPRRMKQVLEMAAKYQVAIEISSSFKLPRLSFLKVAREVGVKFSLGSNGRYPNMGKLDYSIQMAKELGLRRSDMFTPAPEGQKAVQRWRSQRGAASDPVSRMNHRVRFPSVALFPAPRVENP